MALLYFWYRRYNMSSQDKPVGIMLFWKKENIRAAETKKIHILLRNNIEGLVLSPFPTK